VIKRLYEAITGTPWTTGRCASVDFGPTIAARYPELATLSDEAVMRLTPAQAIAYAQAARLGTGEAWMNFIETHLFPHVLGCAEIDAPSARSGRLAVDRAGDGVHPARLCRTGVVAATRRPAPIVSPRKEIPMSVFDRSDDDRSDDPTTVYADSVEFGGFGMPGSGSTGSARSSQAIHIGSFNAKNVAFGDNAHAGDDS